MAFKVSVTNVASKSRTKVFKIRVCFLSLHSFGTPRFAQTFEHSIISIFDIPRWVPVPYSDATVMFSNIIEKKAKNMWVNQSFPFHVSPFWHTRDQKNGYRAKSSTSTYRPSHTSPLHSGSSSGSCIQTRFCWLKLLAVLHHGRRGTTACRIAFWKDVHAGNWKWF